MLFTTQAFNALLKTLEEPPSHAVFILATTEPHKIPLTILSRCQRYDFRRIAQDDIISRMEIIVEAEKATVEKEALQLIAQIAAGGMRDALSLLDQSISNANGAVTLQSVINLTGAVDTRKIGKLIETIATNNIEESLEHFNQCFQSGQEPKFFVEEMMIYLRDILMYEKLGKRATLKKGLTDPAFLQVCKSLSTDKIYLYLDLLQDTMSKMKFHHDIQLLMEMTIVKMIHGEENRLQSQIDELKKLLQSGTAPSNSNPVVTEDTSVVNLPATEQLPTKVDNVEVNEEPVTTEQNFLADFTLDDLRVEPVGTPSNIVEENNEVGEFQLNDVVESTLEESHVAATVMDEEPPFPPSVPKIETNAELQKEEVSFIEMAEKAYQNGENWVEIVDDIPPMDIPTDGEYLEPIKEPLGTTKQITYTSEEERIIEIIKTCSKQEKAKIAEKYDEFFTELKKVNISTASLFREFKIVAVSEDNIIITHQEKPKVVLMKKVKNKSIVESLLEELYRPLSLQIISRDEWDRVLKAF